MLITVFTLLAGLLCGPAYRLRGSVWWSRLTGRGVGTARVLWGAACALVALPELPAWWLPPAIIAAGYAGATLPQWGSIDIGHRDGAYWRDLALQSARGVTSLAGVILALALSGQAWPLALIGGALAGPCYALAWRFPIPVEDLGKDDPPETGELLWGIVAGLGIAGAMILG